VKRNDVITSNVAIQRKMVLHGIQPGLAGLMDGSVSSMAPLFAVAYSTHNTHTTFIVG
jgi:erythrin-vacuolar iron transport family protein